MDISDWIASPKKVELASLGKGFTTPLQYFHIPEIPDAVFIKRHDNLSWHLIQLVKDGAYFQLSAVTINCDKQLVINPCQSRMLDYEVAKDSMIDYILEQTIPRGKAAEGSNKAHLREIINSRVFT